MKIAKRMKNIKPSPTLAVAAKAKAMKAEGIDVIGFGAGEPDFDTPDHIKQAAIAAIESGFTKYTPAGGTVELKQAVAAKLQRDNSLEYKTSEILISCGAKHSLYNAFQALLSEGDEIIIPAPYWVSYPDMAYLAGAVPVVIETSDQSGFKVTPDQVRAAITPRTRAFVLNSPSNPTGAAYSTDELQALANVFLGTDILVISDEIYESLTYDGYASTSIVTVEPRLKEQALVVNGVSKTYSMTGWRIGYAAGPADVIKAMSNIQSQSTSNPTSIAQKAAVAALDGPQDCIAEMLQAFDERRTYMVKRLNAIEGFSCNTPKGAFYTFPTVSGVYGKKTGSTVIQGSSDLATALLDNARVAVVAGSAFGSDANIRLSYATSFENIEKGLDRIEAFVKTLT
jgi:aspartate aminotransferase